MEGETVTDAAEEGDVADESGSEHYESEEHYSSKIKSNTGKKQSLESLIEQSKDSGRSRERNKSEGAAAIIYHEYEDGRIEALFEEKPQSYPVAKERGKIALVGGAVEDTDLNYEYAARREISEEAPDVAGIILRAFDENGEYIGFITNYVDAIVDNIPVRIPVRTYIYKIKIKSDDEWEEIKEADLKEGKRTVLPLEKIITKSLNDFAFGYGSITKKYFTDYHPSQTAIVKRNYIPSSQRFIYSPIILQ